MDLYFIVKAIVVSIVQGLTEFIPVSSTGHMIIVGDLIGFTSEESSVEFRQMFEVVIQVGSIMAIVVLFWKKLWGLFVSLINKEERGIRFAKAIVIGTIPAMVLGLLFEDLISRYLFQTSTVIIGLVVGAFLLLFAENKYRDKAVSYDVDQINWKQALKVGFFQCLAMWPGMSRSGSTISGGWFNRLSSKTAAEFSFFLAIPVMVGASILKMVKFEMGENTSFSALTSTEIFAFVIGFVLAFVVALLCVKAFIAYIKRRPMRGFAFYRLGLSAVLAILAFTGIITVG